MAQALTRIFEPRRELGRTGFTATLLGIGDTADQRIALQQLADTARRAMNAGLNLIDTAPSYEDGYSEQVVGAALKGRREGMFVISKIDHHDEPVAPQVEGSLGRLELDHTDAFVFHGLSTVEGWQRVAADGGGMQQLEGCRQAGKTRFLGISSHNPEVLKLAIESGRCDLVLFAVGPYVDDRYIHEILPLARMHNVGTVCFKTFGAGKLLSDTEGYNQPLQGRPRGKVSSGGQLDLVEPTMPHLSVEECLHYTLTCDPDVALLGMSFPNEQDAAFAAALDFRPLSKERMADIRRRGVEAIANKGRVWWNPNGK